MVFDRYMENLPYERQVLVSRYELVDLAFKVVGVGSVGTRCFIALLIGRDDQDPLFLQMKEATASVLAPYCPPTTYDHQGLRVVVGQRVMQAASDAFLGWASGPERQYYVRQLRDMKRAIDLNRLSPSALLSKAALSGWALARAHARSGDPVLLAGYLGHNDRFERAMQSFAIRYADQVQQDFAAFTAAVREGRLPAAEG